MLTYTLGDTTLFDIDRATGQIMVGAGTMLDFEDDPVLHRHGHGHRPGARHK